MSHQKGFTLVEALLIIIALSLISLTGFYVYNATANVDKTNANAETAGSPTQQKPKVTAPSVKDGTENWTLFTAANNKYSIRLADGWTLQKSEDGNGVSTFSPLGIAPKAGTAAVVEPYPGGRDGQEGLFIGYQTQPYDQETGELQASFTTAQGKKVTVYKVVTTAQEYANRGFMMPGTTSYFYSVSSSEKAYVAVNYTFLAGEADYHDTVEKAVKTIVIK